MKKFTAIVLAIIIGISGMAMTSCGKDMSDSKYCGEWKAANAVYSGIAVDVTKVLGGEFTIDLKSDGKVDVVIAKEKNSGKWEETEGGVKIKDSSDTLTFKDKDGKLQLDYSGITITFEKAK